MPNYRYTGKLKTGKLVKGLMEADNPKVVADNLKKDGVYPLKIAKENIGNKEFSIGNPLKSINARDLSAFCRQFQTMVKAGVSIVEALDILRRQSEKKIMREKVDALYQDVQKGMPLSKSMKRFKDTFPTILVNMVESGEVSGQLDIILDRMAIHFEKENKINQKIKGALIYPTILTLVAIGVIFILVTFVVPSFITMFSDFNLELPFVTVLLYNTGLFMQKYLLVIFLLLLAIGYGVFRFIRTDDGGKYFDHLKLRIPVISAVNKKIATMRFARTLSTMLSSGVSIIEAMETVSGVIGNKVIAHQLEESLERIRKGDGIGKPLEVVTHFPPLLVSMIKIGEETGALDDVLDTTADYYDDEVDAAIDGMIKLIEPFIILVMGVVVGGIMLAIISPMLQMYQNLDF